MFDHSLLMSDMLSAPAQIEPRINFYVVLNTMQNTWKHVCANIKNKRIKATTGFTKGVMVKNINKHTLAFTHAQKFERFVSVSGISSTCQ